MSIFSKLNIKTNAAVPATKGWVTVWVLYIFLVLFVFDFYNYSQCEQKSRAYVDARFNLDPSNPFTVESAIERLFGNGAAADKRLADAEKRIEALEKKLRVNAAGATGAARPTADADQKKKSE